MIKTDLLAGIPGQGEHESRACAQVAFDRHSPVHLLHGMLHNRNAQTGSAHLAGSYETGSGENPAGPKDGKYKDGKYKVSGLVAPPSSGHPRVVP